MAPRVYAHVVTFNSENYIVKCLNSLLEQEEVKLTIEVTDNNSSDNTVALIKQNFPNRVELFINNENIGFSAAHNQAVRRFLKSQSDFFIVVNPDLVFESKALIAMAKAFEERKNIGSITPKLLRAAETLEPIVPSQIDAAGMRFDKWLRHFDRGSGELDTGQYDQPEFVFGGTGAALMFSKKVILDVAWDNAELFDQSFFAYREDAELAWRMQRLGWSCFYQPQAIGYHKRVVVPERRKTLPAKINCLGVRNRFLMQLIHFNFKDCGHCFFEGIILRNLIVLAAVISYEWGSLPAFSQVLKLLPSTLAKRKTLSLKAKVSGREIGQWFTS